MSRLGDILAVEAVVIKGLVLLVLRGTAVIGLHGRLRGQSRAAAAAHSLAAQGTLTAGRAGAQLGFLIRELPFIPAVSRGVDAAAELIVAAAVIRCTAVRADDDIVF